MPLQGLPHALEIVLEQFLMVESIQSWNIHGKDDCTVVTMRFSVQQSYRQEDAKYRRVKPSELRRDNERAAERVNN